MDKKTFAREVLLKQKLLPLYYHQSPVVSVRILQAFYSAGIKMVEFTARGEQALDNFKILKQVVADSMPGLLLGIGTIKSAQQAGLFIGAGVDFIVCPAMNDGVATEAHSAGLLWIPGCMTPTEIAAAEQAGATLVKLFPGSVLGPAYVRAVGELFPRLQFMPTGGVEPEEANLKSWFSAGAAAVGMGGKLVPGELIIQNDYERLKDRAAAALQLAKYVAAQ